MSNEAAAVARACGPAASADQLMASGHERQEGDACTICYLLIELPVNDHSKVNVCCMKRLCDGCAFAARQ